MLVILTVGSPQPYAQPALPQSSVATSPSAGYYPYRQPAQAQPPGVPQYNYPANPDNPMNSGYGQYPTQKQGSAPQLPGQQPYGPNPGNYPGVNSGYPSPQPWQAPHPQPWQAPYPQPGQAPYPQPGQAQPPGVQQYNYYPANPGNPVNSGYSQYPHQNQGAGTSAQQPLGQQPYGSQPIAQPQAFQGWGYQS